MQEVRATMHLLTFSDPVSSLAARAIENFRKMFTLRLIVYSFAI